MRKKIFMVAVATTLGLSGYFFANNRTESDELSGLQIENVEALAGNEIENIHCNSEIDAICVVINDKIVIKGEKY